MYFLSLKNKKNGTVPVKINMLIMRYSFINKEGLIFYFSVISRRIFSRKINIRLRLNNTSKNLKNKFENFKSQFIKAMIKVRVNEIRIGFFSNWLKTDLDKLTKKLELKVDITSLAFFSRKSNPLSAVLIILKKELSLVIFMYQPNVFFVKLLLNWLRRNLLIILISP